MIFKEKDRLIEGCTLAMKALTDCTAIDKELTALKTEMEVVCEGF